MTSPRPSIALIGTLLLVFLLGLSSCSKEELVKPCGEDASGATVKVAGSGGGGEGDAGEASSGGDDQSPDDGAISDDGDDIGDSERKKKRPN